MKKTKRNRGGQKGNQNARAHGFYSSSLNPDETCRFLNILNQACLEPDIAFLRVKVQAVLRHASGAITVMFTKLNRRVIFGYLTHFSLK
jgi:hypothetical protein